jgi:hypothetical protein
MSSSHEDTERSEPVVIDTIVKWVLMKVLSINANFFSGDHLLALQKCGVSVEC